MMQRGFRIVIRCGNGIFNYSIPTFVEWPYTLAGHLSVPNDSFQVYPCSPICVA